MQAEVNPPPYHNWQDAVPDTATFPPPPITGYLISGTGNASEDDAQKAHDFCDNVPLWLPTQPSNAVYSDVEAHDLRPVHPRELRGQVTATARGRWSGRSADRNGDCVIMTQLPMYFPTMDSPFVREQRKTIYFEVRVLAFRAGPAGNGDSGISIGFAAQPYPSWRSPGWERGGLGVFSDDGCRFVNDSFGGREFTTAFRVGETVGIGMVFSLPEDLNIGAGDKKKTCKVEIFFTRNGQRAGAGIYMKRLMQILGASKAWKAIMTCTERLGCSVASISNLVLTLQAGYTSLPSKQLLDAGLVQITHLAKLSKRPRSDLVGLKLAFYMGYCYFC